jgi:hypothetical protein
MVLCILARHFSRFDGLAFFVNLLCDVDYWGFRRALAKRRPVTRSPF